MRYQRTILILRKSNKDEDDWETDAAYKTLNHCFRQIQEISYTFCLFNTMFNLETLNLDLNSFQSM